jgi:hypothetical protein
MKKVLFFAAMLSFAVACGGENKSDNNAEETVVEAVEVVEETVAPEVKAEAAPEVAPKVEENGEDRKLTVVKTTGIKSVEAAETKKADDSQFTASEYKEYEVRTIDDNKNAKQSIKVDGKKKIQVSDTKSVVGVKEVK